MPSTMREGGGMVSLTRAETGVMGGNARAPSESPWEGLGSLQVPV